MRRLCFALDLKNDPKLIEKYIEHHQHVWQEIIDSITQSGIVNMEIYHVGDRLFMIMETREDFDPAEKAKSDRRDPRVQEWESLMDSYQKRLPFADKSQKWVPMNRIFSLKESID